MQMHKNNLVIYRGESFTLDYNVVYGKGEPLIISDQMTSPYLLLSISNTAYSQEKREIRNYWYPLKDFPKFTLTKPLDIQELKNGLNGVSKYSSFYDIVNFPIEGVYLNGKLVERLTENYAVFCNSLEPGVYKYWKNGAWEDYDFRVIQSFTSEDTRTWLHQKYYYSIQLVTGTEVREYLSSLYRHNFLDTKYLDMSNQEIYDVLKDKVEFPVDFDMDKPLVKIDNSIPILAPTAITVVTYMQGDTTW